jgi:hypothetical protein
VSWFVGTCRASAEPKDFDPSPTNQIPCGLVARQLTCLERPSKAIQVYSLRGWLWAGLTINSVYPTELENLFATMLYVCSWSGCLKESVGLMTATWPAPITISLGSARQHVITS